MNTRDKRYLWTFSLWGAFFFGFLFGIGLLVSKDWQMAAQLGTLGMAIHSAGMLKMKWIDDELMEAKK